MAIHSSTLAWKIPWTEEPDRLQPMGSQRVGHDWATSLFTFMKEARFTAHWFPFSAHSQFFQSLVPVCLSCHRAFTQALPSVGSILLFSVHYLIPIHLSDPSLAFSLLSSLLRLGHSLLWQSWCWQASHMHLHTLLWLRTVHLPLCLLRASWGTVNHPICNPQHDAQSQGSTNCGVNNWSGKGLLLRAARKS